MKNDLVELRALISNVVPEAGSIDDVTLEALGGVRVPVAIDLGKVEFPTVIAGKPVTTTIVDVLGDDHTFSIALADILKKSAIPATQAVHSFVTLAPFEGTLSVLEVLGIVASRFTFLDREQLAICRAVLLVTDSKKTRVLSEKSANADEIREAILSQKEDVPFDLEAVLKALVEKHVLETEEVESKTHYKVTV